MRKITWFCEMEWPKSVWVATKLFVCGFFIIVLFCFYFLFLFFCYYRLSWMITLPREESMVIWGKPSFSGWKMPMNEFCWFHFQPKSCNREDSIYIGLSSRWSSVRMWVCYSFMDSECTQVIFVKFCLGLQTDGKAPLQKTTPIGLIDHGEVEMLLT